MIWDKYDDGDNGGGGVGDDDDDNDNDDTDCDDLTSLYRHAQRRKEAHQKKIMAHPFSDYTDWSNWQYKIAICRVYIYLVLKKLVIRLSVDLTYVFHNTKQIWRAQVDFLRRRKLSDQNDLLENLKNKSGDRFLTL